MRTTLDIDDDVLAAVKEKAAAEKTTAGKVISELARQALTQTTPAGGDQDLRHGFLYEDGWYVQPSRGTVITNQLLDQIQDQLDREDALTTGRERARSADG